MKDQEFEQAQQRLGVSRRGFLKFCTGVAASMGLPAGAAMKIAHAIENPKRPPVIWLSGQQCTGCSETLLRSNHPTFEGLILDMISLDYHETLSTPAGHNAEDARKASMELNKGKYLLVVDGSIPTKDGGVYCKIAGKTILQHVQEASENAVATVAMGSCAAWGGIPSSGPNPTGAKGVHEVLPGKTVINIPGCPPNPYNFLSTVLHFVTFGTLPALDDKARPKFAYGRLIHENCERRAHFDAGRFALEFGDEGHKKGHCLYKLGCKGPETMANCSIQEFGDVGGGGAWPVGVGHPCFGCTEKGVGFTKPIHALADVKTHTPPNSFAAVDEKQGTSASPGAAALIGAVVGGAIGATAMAAKGVKKADEASSEAGND